MNNLVENKFKDKYPKDSINMIRNKLNEIGIMPIESSWFNKVEGYYSVYLKLPYYNIFSNGKGINYDFALASAYGEFIERLQNQIIYRNKVEFSDKVKKFNGFKFAPDEKYLDYNDIKLGYKDEVPVYFPTNQKEFVEESTIENLKQIDNYEFNDKIISVPFFNKSNQNICYVPIPILDICYGSNGMCAGNTPEEALIEGICELLERYSKMKIFNGEIVAPDIPSNYIKQFEVPYNMILELCKSQRYNIIVKDCSLGIGIPVVGAALIDLQEQTYFWSFGSHPSFEIALTRTLTEMLQGKDLNSSEYMSEFSFVNEKVKLNEKLSIFKNGIGKYPIKSFSNEYSYKFKEFLDVNKKDNKDLLKDLLNLLGKNNFNLLVRDVSFLGVPSYHVIIPGISEIFELSDSNLDLYIKRRKIEKLLQNVNKLSDQELGYIVEYLSKHVDLKNGTMMDFIHVPLKNNFPWNNIKVSLFLGMASYKLGNYEKSNYYINMFIKDLEHSGKNESLKYYKCVRDYIGTKIKEDYSDKGLYILELFYGKELLEDIINEFENKEDIFKYYGELNCWECEECPYKDICLYKTLESVHIKLKEKYLQNNINQNESILLNFLH